MAVAARVAARVIARQTVSALAGMITKMGMGQQPHGRTQNQNQNQRHNRSRYASRSRRLILALLSTVQARCVNPRIPAALRIFASPIRLAKRN